MADTVPFDATEDTAAVPTALKTRERVRGLLTRQQLAVYVKLDRRHAEAVERWAADGAGPIPTRADVAAELREENAALISALGWLAVLEPEEAFPRLRILREAWEREWEHDQDT